MKRCPFCAAEMPDEADSCETCGSPSSSVGEQKTDPLEERMFELLREGRKIEAIKVYREETGLDLWKSKEEVDALELVLANQPKNPPRPELKAEPFHDRVTEALRAGQKLEAIRIYREETDLDLGECKEAVDALDDQLRASEEVDALDRQIRAGVSNPSPLSEQEGESLEDRILEQLRVGRKIEAIRIYRKETGTGLKEAKEAVDAMQRRHGMPVESAGCVLIFAWIFTMVAGGAYLAHAQVFPI